MSRRLERGILKTLINSKYGNLALAGLIAGETLVACNTTPSPAPTETPRPTATATAIATAVPVAALEPTKAVPTAANTLQVSFQPAPLTEPAKTLPTTAKPPALASIQGQLLPPTPESTAPTPESTASTSATTPLHKGDTYTARIWDVIPTDISINGIRQYDDDPDTGVINVIPTGQAGASVRADQSDTEIIHTDGSPEAINKAIAVITAGEKIKHGQGFRVDVKIFGKDAPQGSASNTVSTASSITTAETTTAAEIPTSKLLGVNEVYAAKKGDVIRFDGSINDIKWNDDLGSTALIVTISEDGRKIVKAVNGGEVYFTDGSPGAINKVVTQVKTGLEKQHKNEKNFRVDVKTYETGHPQVLYTPLKIDTGNQSEPPAFYVKKDLLNPHNGAALMWTGNVIGPSGPLERGYDVGHITLMHGDNIPDWIAILPVSGDLKVIQPGQDLQEMLQIQIYELRKKGFTGVIKIRDITYTNDWLEQDVYSTSQ